MTTHVKITDTSYIRDIRSKAVLNTDKNGLSEYLLKRDIARKQMNEQQEVKTRLSVVEEDIQEIKTLLKELIQLRNVNGN